MDQAPADILAVVHAQQLQLLQQQQQQLQQAQQQSPVKVGNQKGDQSPVSVSGDTSPSMGVQVSPSPSPGVATPTSPLHSPQHSRLNWQAAAAAVHSDKHSDDSKGPVQCTVCERRFKTLPALNGHMRLHGGYMKKREYCGEDRRRRPRSRSPCRSRSAVSYASEYSSADRRSRSRPSPPAGAWRAHSRAAEPVNFRHSYEVRRSPQRLSASVSASRSPSSPVRRVQRSQSVASSRLRRPALEARIPRPTETFSQAKEQIARLLHLPTPPPALPAVMASVDRRAPPVIEAQAALPQSDVIQDVYAAVNKFLTNPHRFQEKDFLHPSRLPKSLSSFWCPDFYQTSDSPVNLTQPILDKCAERMAGSQRKANTGSLPGVVKASSFLRHGLQIASFLETATEALSLRLRGDTTASAIADASNHAALHLIVTMVGAATDLDLTRRDRALLNMKTMPPDCANALRTLPVGGRRLFGERWDQVKHGFRNFPDPPPVQQKRANTRRRFRARPPFRPADGKDSRDPPADKSKSTIARRKPNPSSGATSKRDLPANAVKAAALRAEVAALLHKQAVEVVEVPTSPGFYSHVFVVPKPGGRRRPVVDLSALNAFITAPHFRMETAAAVRASTNPGDLRPWVFTRLMDAVAARVRLVSLSQLSNYLDDLLLKHQVAATLASDRDRLLCLLQQLGFLVNAEKSDLSPSQNYVHLGMQFDTVRNLVSLPQKRIDSILEAVSILVNQPTSPARHWLRVLGLLSAAADLLPLGRLRTRRLQLYLLSQWRPFSGDLDRQIDLPPHLLQELAPWSDPVWLAAGVPLQRPSPTLSICVDASKDGWGAHLLPSFITAHSLWSPADRAQHINWLELKAVFLALQHWLPQIAASPVLVMSDNSTVVSYIRKQGGTKSTPLCELTRDLLLWCEAHSIDLSARHIPGRLNVIADSLSRCGQILHTEWSLSPSAFQSICQRWDRPHVDLFATRWNHKLPLFVSPVPDPQAWAVDALSIPWDGLFAFAYPPAVLIPKILQ
nr:hypothetical protein BaRGS_035129 [Batillaria attramentaria]